ncbi:MAG: Fe-S cluster assembly protein SufD [Gammaproteobacteria bacterium]|nr:Fe-S cluster assembly protein SufD [Gammaproteobacteria bacterium]
MNTNPVTEMMRLNNTVLPGQNVDWLQQVRSSALSILLKKGFPHKKHEDWKYTNIQSLIEQEYTLTDSTCNGLMSEDIEHLYLSIDEDYRIVFVNGQYSPQLSVFNNNTARDRPEFEINSLAKVITEQPEVLQPYLACYVDPEEHGFNALNTASINDGLYLRIFKNIQINEPIHVLYLTTAADGLLVLPRNLILLDNHAQATVVEHYASLGNANMMVDAVSETMLSLGAKLEHIKIQQESIGTSHIASHTVLQQRDSKFSSTVISTGGKLVRSDIHTRLVEKGGECVLNGLYIADEMQHMDFHTFIEHAAPSCSSHQDYRGVLDDRSRAVFNGRVYVHKNAQQSNAEQSNKTLLLSSKAEMDSKPQLEIYNDDVKCSHGATVGQLDEDMLFYLRSRGLDQQTARSFLVKGFIGEVLQRRLTPLLRKRIEQWLSQRLNLENAEKEVLQ